MARKCCCGGGGACQGYCPDGPPEQWQITVPDTVYTAEGTEDFTCEETQCDERAGVFLLSIVGPDDIATEWFPVHGAYQAGDCLWIGESFETCQFWTEDFGGSPVLVTWTLRWQLQMSLNGTHLYLCQITGPGTFGIDADRWEADISETECGDPLTFVYDPEQTLGFGCTVDEMSEIVAELPP